MKKKTVIAVILAVALLALLIFGLPLFSRLYYGRSQAATLFAWQLHKEAYTAEEDFEDYLAEKREENAQPYLLPLELEFSVTIRPVARGQSPGYILNEDAPRAVFYFPGGSYIDQPRAVHWTFLNDLAEQADVAIVVPIYAKLPEADAETAYGKLSAFYLDCLEDDGPWEEIVFMGDSAGGGMALSFAMQLRDAGIAGPDRLILICPWADVTLTNPDIPDYGKKDRTLDAEQLRHLGALWAGSLSPDDPVVSPLYGRFDGLGPVTLLTTTEELLYPDIQALYEKMQADGADAELIVRPGMFHVWPLYVGYSVPEVEETFADIAAMLR